MNKHHALWRTLFVALCAAGLVACGSTPSTPTDAPPTSPVMQSPISPTPNEQSGNLPGRTISTVSPNLAMTPAPLQSPLSNDASNLQTPAVMAARNALAKKLQRSPDAIKVVSVEEVQWPDGCLGIKQPGVMCIQIIVDGFRIVLESDGTRYEYHTDATGRQAVLAPR